MAFTSEGSFDPGDWNAVFDVYVRDLVRRTTTLVSVDSRGRATGGSDASISADGRFVAYGGETPTGFHVFVRDLGRRTTAQADVSTGGVEGAGTASWPTISGDGRFVAFDSAADNLVPGDTNHTSDVFIRDLVKGTTTRASVGAGGGQGNDYSTRPKLSRDGRIVAFETAAATLAPGATWRAPTVLVRDLSTGTNTPVIVGAGGAARTSLDDISEDGARVAFSTDAALVPGDTNGRTDVFVRDLHTRTTTRVSVGSDSSQGNRDSGGGSLSFTGNWVVFSSYARGLVAKDTNHSADVFLRRLP